MSKIEISEIAIEPIENKNGLVGFANFVINGDLKICNVAVYSSPNRPEGIRLVFPVKEYKGIRLKTIYPINSNCYDEIVFAISNAYQNLMTMMR